MKLFQWDEVADPIDYSYLKIILSLLHATVPN